VKIKLADGKERQIEHMTSTLFYGPDGKPISAEEFLRILFGKLPEFFTSEEQLRAIWSTPSTRRALLDNLTEAGFGKEELRTMQTLIDADNSDLFDVLEYISFANQPITRELRVAKAQSKIFGTLNAEQKQFLEFVLSKYIETGVEELDQEKLAPLLVLKYKAIEDAKEILGTVETIRNIFIGFQKHLYEQQVGA
ncbi:MAG: restriction endonuclease subunit R, partial [Anaerolineales bacterium]|nr:restriction endonuclease subunit R [Anaerolineales bacterium]